jgi:hypothetical protein
MVVGTSNALNQSGERAKLPCFVEFAGRNERRLLRPPTRNDSTMRGIDLAIACVPHCTFCLDAETTTRECHCPEAQPQGESIGFVWPGPSPPARALRRTVTRIAPACRAGTRVRTDVPLVCRSR